MNPIEQIHALVWQFRKDNSDWWMTPEPDDCIRYAFTEAGELMDAYLRSKRTGDARNNDKLVEIDHELADVAIMLVSFFPVAGFPYSVTEIWTAICENTDSIDEVCSSLGYAMDAIREDLLPSYEDVVHPLFTVLGYATNHKIDLVAQVQRNLEAIKLKHVPGVVLKRR